MKYRQFDHLDQIEGDFYRKITEIVAEHLDTDGDSAAFLGETLISKGFINRYQVFDLSKDITALERINKALQEISRAMSDASISPLAIEKLHQSLLFGKFFDNMLSNDYNFDRDDFSNYLEKTGRQDLEALARIEADVIRIRAGVEKTIHHIKQSPLAKKSASKFKSDGVGVVSACRFVWELATRKRAPKSLNPESPFAYFLADVLEAGNIEVKPISAFNAWVRETQKSTVGAEKTAPSIDD